MSERVEVLAGQWLYVAREMRRSTMSFGEYPTGTKASRPTARWAKSACERKVQRRARISAIKKAWYTKRDIKATRASDGPLR